MNKKRLKIGIIEIYAHHVFVHTLASIAQNSGMDVSIFVTRQIYDDLIILFGKQINQFTWILKQENENDWQFLRRIRKKINIEIDLLFINTIQGKQIVPFYFFKTNVKTIIATGRISEWFGNQYKFPDGNIRFFHHNITHFLLPRMLLRYDSLIVHTPQALDYTRAHRSNKNILLLPFSLYTGKTKNKESNPSIKFLVTGQIKKRTRDYIGLLKAFESIWSIGRQDLSLTILSNPRDKYGYTVVDYVKKMQKKGFDLKYFSQWIPENVYLNETESADIYIAPIKHEYYSCGELTSGIVEAIRQGKPVIYPAGYLPDSRLKSSSLFYDKIEDLPEIILNILNNRNLLKQLSLNAVANAKKYSLEVTTTYFNKNVQTLSD